MPGSLRVFHYFNQLEKPWQNTLPALNVLSDKIDTFALDVRSLSLHLRELKISHVAVTSDIFWPLDSQGRAAGCEASLHWPYLETIEFDEVPDYLSSGKLLPQLISLRQDTTPLFPMPKTDSLFYQGNGSSIQLLKIMTRQKYLTSSLQNCGTFDLLRNRRMTAR